MSILCMVLTTAMILAAGRGERLRPLTDRVPKPLVRIGSTTLIDTHLSALAVSGFQHVVINLAHLGQQIRDHVGNGNRFGLSVKYSSEPEGALETAGGIARALPLLDSNQFLVVNGDVLCDVDFSTLKLPEGSDLHLLMTKNPTHHPQGDFVVDDADEPSRLQLRSNSRPTLTFTGIGVYRCALFSQLPRPRYPLAPVIREAIHAGTATAQIHQGLWMDIGTPERLKVAQTLMKT